MTKAELEEYRSLLEEISELSTRIKKLLNKTESDFEITDSVTASSKSFPYTAHQVKIRDIDYYALYRNNEKASQLKNVLETQIDKLIELETKIEQFINTIPESISRRIMRYVYIEGLTQEDAARKVHLDQSRISRRIDGILKNA